MSDLAVRGGRVVMSDGIVDADILVLSGHISAIVPPDEGTAREEIDARGLVVLPGVVDTHVHMNEPGRTEWEGFDRDARRRRGWCDHDRRDAAEPIPPTTSGGVEGSGARQREALRRVGFWGGS